MKIFTRILSVYMAFAFLLATTGISVYEHYCSGNLVDLSIYTSETNCSPEGEGNCSSSNNMDCCDDQMQFLKLEIDLQNLEKLKNTYLQLSFNILYNIPLVESIPDVEKIQFQGFPPILHKSPLYIQNQQLTFYS